MLGDVTQENLTLESYSEKAMDTLSKTAMPDRVSLYDLMALLRGAANMGNLADHLKRALMYPKYESDVLDEGHNINPLLSRMYVTANEDPKNVINLLHGLLGKISEIGEFCDSIEASFQNTTPFDRPNLLEEMGDDTWYNPLIAMALGFTMREFMFINLVKLDSRHSGREFDPKTCLEEGRDRLKERAILEVGTRTNLREMDLRDLQDHSHPVN